MSYLTQIFVLRYGQDVVAIEAKSGGRKESFPGMKAFAKHFKPKRMLLIGDKGIPLKEFLLTPV